MEGCGVIRFICVETEGCLWVPNVPSLSVLLWKKSNFVFNRARNRVNAQRSCAILKLSIWVLCSLPQASGGY